MRDRGAEVLELEVLAVERAARAVYERWGFSPVELTLAAPIDALVRRLERLSGADVRLGPRPDRRCSTVERAVQKVLPRLGRSEGTTVTGPGNGWVTVHDELCDRDPRHPARLAKELSYANGGVVLALGVEDGALVRYTLVDRGSSSTSTRRCRSTAGRCRPAT